jgi:hypothetical protein
MATRGKRTAAGGTTETPAQQLEGFISRYAPDVAATARAVLPILRARFAGAAELVYDNYNALAIGWSPTGKTQGVVCSIALYPRWVSLFFMRGAELPDPHHRLRGGGKTVRHVVLAAGARTLDEPAIKELLDLAIARAPAPSGANPAGPIIKSVSPTQRPRRPAAGTPKPRATSRPSPARRGA